jgi:hypothetical protein
VDGLVAQVARGRQIRVDQLADVGFSIGKTDVFYGSSCGGSRFQVIAQQLDLGALPASVHPFKQNKCTTTFKTWHLLWETKVGKSKEDYTEQQYTQHFVNEVYYAIEIEILKQQQHEWDRIFYFLLAPKMRPIFQGKAYIS